MYKTEILERKRLERGESYTEIADRLGMHKVTVSRTLKGVTMKPRTVKMLADYLGVEMERIVQLALLSIWVTLSWSDSYVLELERVLFV
ncbi:MAG: helix-turn-helix transcriptional regulator [Nitrospiraceae bacterium]|nr:helix-turn-helix transcriptional regulator [Nitrospiraceae bacterium]